MKPIFEVLFGGRLRQETDWYLREIAQAAAARSTRRTNDLLRSLSSATGSKIVLGTTPTGRFVTLPVDEIVRSHGMVTGASGTGKTRVGLKIIDTLIEAVIEQER